MAPTGVAVNTASGEVYVTDPALRLGLRFAADGTILPRQLRQLRLWVRASRYAARRCGRLRQRTCLHRRQRQQPHPARSPPAGVALGSIGGSRERSSASSSSRRGVTIGPNREVVRRRHRQQPRFRCSTRRVVHPRLRQPREAVPASSTGPSPSPSITMTSSSSSIRATTEFSSSRPTGQVRSARSAAPGRAPGQFNGPTGIATDEGDVAPGRRHGQPPRPGFQPGQDRPGNDQRRGRVETSAAGRAPGPSTRRRASAPHAGPARPRASNRGGNRQGTAWRHAVPAGIQQRPGRVARHVSSERTERQEVLHDGHAAAATSHPAEAQPIDTIKSVALPTGVTLPYVEQGDSTGVPVVLLHGGTDSWRSFQPVLPYLPGVDPGVRPDPARARRRESSNDRLPPA